MKILLFKEDCIEPFKIYHDPSDVIICNNGTVSIQDSGNNGQFELVHLATELIDCNDQRELCLLIFVEEKLQ